MTVARKRPESKILVLQPNKSVRLYFDEMDTILSIMRKIGDEITIETPDFAGTINSPQDLEVISSERISKCTFHAGTKEREIWVWIDSSTAITISPSDDILLAGASMQIQNLMVKAQRTFGGINFVNTIESTKFAFASVITFVTGVLGGFLAVFGTHVGSGRAKNGRFHIGAESLVFMSLGLVALVCAGILVVAFTRHNPKPAGCIVMAYRKDAPTWWQRNRTAVGISLVTNAFVAVLSFVAGRAIG